MNTLFTRGTKLTSVQHSLKRMLNKLQKRGKMKLMCRSYICLTLLLSILLLAGCASQPTQINTNAPGFFIGLWHGYFAILALIAGFFTEIRIYNFPNSGYWYDVGFVLGFFGFLSSAVSAA